MKIQGSTNLSFSVAILLQTWLLSFATPVNTTLQSENPKEEFAFSMYSFLPTAALSKEHSALISHQCLDDSRLVLKALSNRTEWALSSIKFFFLILFFI